MNSAEIRSILSLRIATITFRKVNGDLRVMDCTTNGKFIPPSAWPSGKVTISEEVHDRTIRVFDVKAQQWRSFIVENVIEVK